MNMENNTITSFSRTSIATQVVATVFFIVCFFTTAYSQHGQYILDASSNGVPCNAATSSSRGITPFVHDRKSLRSRYLYYASEMNVEEGSVLGPREITSLAFDVTELGSSYTINDFNVRIAQVGPGNLANDMNALPGSVLVKTISSFTVTELGWFEIAFDTPFMWDGTSNIVVEICKTNSSVGSLPKNVEVATTKFTLSSPYDYRTWALYTNINNNPSAGGCDMIAHSNPTNTAQLAASSRKERPNIRFTLKCMGSPIAGEAIQNGTSNYCLAEDVVLQVVNGDRSSGLVYKWYSSEDNMAFSEILGATTENLTVTRLPINTYYMRATACSDDLTYFNSLTVLVEGINTWDGTQWSMGYTPILAQPLTIDGNFDSAIDGSLTEACSVHVKSGTIIVRSGNTLKVKEKLIVDNGANVIFENSATLLQENNLVVNQGKIKYRRDSQPVRVLDFTYWSSPVSGQTPAAFSVGTPGIRIYHWNHIASVQNWINGIQNLPMIAGKGYIIRAPNGFPSTGEGQVFHGEFYGVPNNGTITVNTQGKNTNPTGPIFWNLIGNPYPSAVDADLFLLANQDKIDGTLKYWTHNTRPSSPFQGSSALLYDSNDYASYNFTGSVGASYGDAAGTITDPNDPAYVTNTTEPGRYIAAGQSFMVAGGTTAGESTVVFKNEMRKSGDNNVFFRTANATSTLEKNRIWLEMKHQDGAFKQTLVGYVEGATNGVDWGFDGKMLETSPVLIYTKADEQNLIIQGKALPFTETDQIPLSFSSTLSGTFELNLYRFDGLFTNQMVYVEDTYSNIIHDLKNGVYTFNSGPGVFDDRFVIRFTNQTLGNPSSSINDTDIICFTKNEAINIKAFNQIIAKVAIFDASGRLLFENSKLNSSELKIESISHANQLLIVKVTSTEGTQSTYKLIY